MRAFVRWVVVALTAVVLSAPAIAAERAGKVKVASGDVKITRDGQVIAVEAGTEVFEADVIETGENSAVGMTFSDNSRVSLGPNSSMTVEAYSYQSGGKDEFDARLQRGSLTAASGLIAKSRPLAMRVLMPTTVLGVKGTEFAVRVGG